MNNICGIQQINFSEVQNFTLMILRVLHTGQPGQTQDGVDGVSLDGGHVGRAHGCPLS